jgi:uncharacterized membrane protein YccC
VVKGAAAARREARIMRGRDHEAGRGVESCKRSCAESLPALETRMSQATVALPPWWSRQHLRRALQSMRPTWSTPAAYRALRAVLVIPSLFAIGTEVLHNGQVALFATFGGFAGVVLSNFGGSRRDRLRAHVALAVAGSVLLTIGTAISSSAAVAAPIALVVVFVVIVAGVFGSNAASGTTSVLLSFILPAASAGSISLVPFRLEGWWLAMAAGTILALVLSPRPEGDRLRQSAARALEALSVTTLELGSRQVDPAELAQSRKTRDDLVRAYSRSPSRPIGVGAADQAIADLAETVQWAVSLVDEVAAEKGDFADLDSTDLRLMTTSAQVFGGAGRLLSGDGADLPISELESLVRQRDENIETYAGAADVTETSMHLSFHSRMIAGAARTAALDALTVARRGSRSAVGQQTRGVRRLKELPQEVVTYVSSLYSFLRTHSGLATVTFLNAVRGGIAIAAAVAIADLTNVEHGFWVVLGALSVLRSNAASTGVNAWRALLGTAIGFAVGAALLVGIGGNTDLLWAMFPISVAVAAYAPGTAPFAVGQAAFTVMLVIVFNLIVPVGWSIGVVRIEDIAIGLGVSLVAGVLFWPRGAAGVVRSVLSDAFHYDGLFLVQATTWALGRRASPPEAGEDAARADIRLGDAMRALMAEQGARRVPKEEAWRLVASIGRLRSTARSLAGAPRHEPVGEGESLHLLERAVRLAGLCDSYGSEIASRPPTVAQELSALAFRVPVPDLPASSYGRWINEHLDEAHDELEALSETVTRAAEAAKMRWWR